MKLTCNRRSALRILRAIRSDSECRLSSYPKTDLISPDPAPGKRWTRKLIDFSRFGLETSMSARQPLDVAVGSMGKRIQMKYARCSIYAGESCLPTGSFIDLREGLAISCPELLFVEMAKEMDPARHLMLGHELCGSFSRDPNDPRNGQVALDLTPVTSKARIAAYMEKASHLHGITAARRTLELLSDNAWSPTESLVATIVSLPIALFGYGLGACALNKRLEMPEQLRWTTDMSSRVPDILFPGVNVGLNYDGAVHLDLDSVIDAAVELERHPGEGWSQAQLDSVMRSVRSKAVDDIRRNRELAANGYLVFPVVKEDLYDEGALDRLMAQVFEIAEEFFKCDYSLQKRMLKLPLGRARRQELIWSLLPGKQAGRHAKKLLPPPKKTPQLTEVTIGL